MEELWTLEREQFDQLKLAQHETFISPLAMDLDD